MLSCEKPRISFPPLYFNSNLIHQNKQQRLSHAGHCIVLRIDYTCWLFKLVRYANDCTLQPAGEAQSSPVGYQAGTRQLSSSFRATYRHCGTRVPTYAKKTKQLYMSPPEHSKV